MQHAVTHTPHKTSKFANEKLRKECNLLEMSVG